MNVLEPPTLAEDEKLARFVLKKEWVRKVDNSIKPDAFIPPKDLQLSVTRHSGISTEELIETGRSVANETSLEFFGRADVETGWPAEKEFRKLIAQELAAAAAFIPI